MDFLTSETSKEISDDNARNSILKDKHRRVLRTTVLIFSFTAYVGILYNSKCEKYLFCLN